MQNITIIGRLTRDAVLAKTKNGTAVAKFTVAAEKARRSKAGEDPGTNYVPVELYGNEGVQEYLKKGTPVAVYCASIQTGSYKNDAGNTVYTWVVTAQKLQLLPEGKMTGSTGVDLIGRLTADCSTSYTRGSNTCVTTFTIAVDRRSKEKSADFIPVTLYGKLGEAIGRYLVKGKMVNVRGRLDTGSFKRSDGTTVNTWKVVADDLFLLGDGKRAASGAEEPTAEPAAHQQELKDLEETGFIELPDEFDEEYFGDEEF